MNGSLEIWRFKCLVADDWIHAQGLGAFDYRRASLNMGEESLAENKWEMWRQWSSRAWGGITVLSKLQSRTAQSKDCSVRKIEKRNSIIFHKNKVQYHLSSIHRLPVESRVQRKLTSTLKRQIEVKAFSYIGFIYCYTAVWCIYCHLSWYAFDR